jgi:hypothetical protein
VKSAGWRTRAIRRNRTPPDGRLVAVPLAEPDALRSSGPSDTATGRPPDPPLAITAER